MWMVIELLLFVGTWLMLLLIYLRLLHMSETVANLNDKAFLVTGLPEDVSQTSAADLAKAVREMRPRDNVYMPDGAMQGLVGEPEPTERYRGEL